MFETKLPSKRKFNSVYSVSACLVSFRRGSIRFQVSGFPGRFNIKNIISSSYIPVVYSGMLRSVCRYSHDVVFSTMLTAAILVLT